MTIPTLNWAQTAAVNPNTPICFDWGTALDRALVRCGSRRCHSRRASQTPLDFGMATPIAQEDV